MDYRDELEAARRRAAQLEDRIRDLEEEKRSATHPPLGSPRPPAPPGPATSGLRVFKPAAKVNFGLAGVLVFVLFGFGISTGCTRGCLAAEGDLDALALGALRACAPARALLGDDVDYSLVGCANLRSRSGGDPLVGMHSSASWQLPVAGSAGRGSFEFSTVSPPNASTRFLGGRLITKSGVIVIPPDGASCVAPQ